MNKDTRPPHNAIEQTEKQVQPLEKDVVAQEKEVEYSMHDPQKVLNKAMTNRD